MPTYNSFQQLAYINKVGAKPANNPKTPRPEPHKGNWNLEYLGKVLEYNKPYAICAASMKQYKMQSGYNKSKFNIVPCLV